MRLAAAPLTTKNIRERITCSVAEARAASGLGKTKLYALMEEGVLQSTTVGRKRLIEVESLLRLLEPNR